MDGQRQWAKPSTDYLHYVMIMITFEERSTIGAHCLVQRLFDPGT